MFFSCNVSSRIWKDLMELGDLEAPPICWATIVDVEKQEWRKKVLKFFVCRLAFGAAVYHIWRTRNDLRHGNSPFSEVQILQRIK
jgi:hypothetical protein